MKKSYRDPELGSVIVLADQENDSGRFSNKEFFKIIWNRGPKLSLKFDGHQVELKRDQLICLTPLQNPDLSGNSSKYYSLLFNREFYCIHENDNEVSCEGLLFWGSSDLPVIQLNEEEKPKFDTLFQVFEDELGTRDNIQGEMLRMLLKRLIIKSTRIARKQLFPDGIGSKQTELIRQFNILVEQHYKQHHQVSEYAEMLYKSPKTLSNVFASAGHKTPLELIHNRIALEGKRQLLKTDRLAKEIAYDLGFEEQAHFSRFFKKETGMAPSVYRQKAEK
jgi:AraC-like DNA-binding protein